MRENRLEIVIGARDTEFKQSMQRLAKDAAATGKAMADSFKTAGTSMEDALDGVEFKAIAEEAKRTSLAVTKSFAKSGEDLQKAFDDAGGDGLGKRATMSLQELRAEAAEVKQALKDAFIDGENQSKATADAVRRLEAALKNTGEDGAKAFQQIERALDKVNASVLADKLAKAEQAAQEFGAAAKAEMASVGGAVDGLAGEVGKLGEGIDNLNFDAALGRAAELGQSAKAAIDQAAAGFLQAGDEGRAFERIIKGAFADTASQDAFIKKAQEIKDAYKDAVSLEEIGLAAQKLDLLGAGTPENLERVAKVARDAGRGLDDVGEILGEALSPLEAGNFDVGVFEEMRVSLGISAKALKEYGAEVDINGKILGETAEQQRKAQQALKSYIDEADRYADVATRIQDNYSQAQGEVDKFNRAIGDQVNEFKNVLAGAALPYLKMLNEMPEAMKVAVAGFAMFGPPVAGIITTMGQLYGVSRLVKLGMSGVGASTAEAGAAASKLAPVAGAADKLKTAMGGLVGTAQKLATTSLGVGAAVAGIGLVLIPVALAFRDYQKSLIDAEIAEQALIDTQAKASIKYKEHTADIYKTVTALKAEADALQDNIAKRNKLTADIALKSGEADSQRRQGNTSRADQLDSDANALRAYRATVDAENSKIAKSESDRFEKSRQAYLQYERDVQRGNFDTKKQQLQALESAMGGLEGDALQQALSARKALNAQVLAEEIATLKAIAAEQNLSAKDVETRLQRLLGVYQSTGEARKGIEKDIDDFTKAREDARLDRLRQLAAEELDLKRSALDLDREGAEADDERIAALQAQLDAGKDVSKELEREIAGRSENQKRLLEAEAALTRIAIKQQAAADAGADPGNAKKVYELAAERERQLDQHTAQQRAKIDREQSRDQAANIKKRSDAEAAAAAKKLELEAKQAELAARSADQQRQAQENSFVERRRQYEEETALGYDRSRELRTLDDEQAKAQRANIKEQTELAIEGINKRAAAEKAGKSSQEQSIIEQTAQLDIDQARARAKQETNSIVDKNLVLLREQTAEEVKQLELLTKKNAELKKGQGFKSTFTGQAYGVDQINENASGFGVSRNAQATTEDGRNEEQVKRDIERSRARVGQMEAERKRQDAARPEPVKARDAAIMAQQGYGRESAPSANNGMTTAQGAELIGAVKALQQTLGQAAAALNRREPSMLGQGWGRGGLRLPGIEPA